MRTVLALTLAALLSTLPAAPAAAGGSPLYDIRLESDVRETTLGDEVAYDLYVPVPAASRPAPPWPAVVLNHGFSRTKRYHSRTARYLARRGIVVLVPNQVSLLGGASAQARNVANTRDHVEWLFARAGDRRDTLFGLVDPLRTGLAGHSAGGAIAFEAAVAPGPELQAVLLLDAVPWLGTLGVADRVDVPSFASLRSEPSPCNAAGSVLSLLSRLAFATEDVKLVDATHCDPEGPTGALCPVVCGGTSVRARSRYRRLTYLFFQDALGVPTVEPRPDTYDAALLRGVGRGTIEVTPIAPGP